MENDRKRFKKILRDASKLSDPKTSLFIKLFLDRTVSNKKTKLNESKEVPFRNSSNAKNTEKDNPFFYTLV